MSSKLKTTKEDKELHQIIFSLLNREGTEPMRDAFLNFIDDADLAERLEKENEELIKTIAECRASAGFGSKHDPMGKEGWNAFADPSSVPDFIRSQFQKILKENEELRKSVADEKEMRERDKQGMHEILRNIGLNALHYADGYLPELKESK